MSMESSVEKTSVIEIIVKSNLDGNSKKQSPKVKGSVEGHVKSENLLCGVRKPYECYSTGDPSVKE